ncbi:MAG: class I SAM-dependent methyltransferase [Candidatus Gorgyraea atricola]|nr:class I SAM-dependent methyltransferase [Candidatus Gorgyraea atricola]
MKIKKSYNIALIFTLILGIFLYSTPVYSLRPSHGYSPEKRYVTDDRFNALSIKSLVQKIEEVKKRKINIKILDKQEEVIAVSWRVLLNKIFDQYPELNNLLKKLYDRHIKHAQNTDYTRVYDLEKFYRTRKEALILGNLSPSPSTEEKELYDHRVISDLREQVLSAALSEYNLKWSLLHALLRNIAPSKPIVKFDFGQGANPGTCIGCTKKDIVVGLNNKDVSTVTDTFIALNKDIGLTSENISTILKRKSANIRNPGEIKNAIEEVARDNRKSFQASFRILFFNQLLNITISDIVFNGASGIKAANINTWTQEINSLIREGDLLVVCGADSSNLETRFLGTGEFRDITNEIPSPALNVFKSAIADRFYITSSDFNFQHIYSPGQPRILKKTGKINLRAYILTKLTEYLSIGGHGTKRHNDSRRDIFTIEEIQSTGKAGIKTLIDILMREKRPWIRAKASLVLEKLYKKGDKAILNALLGAMLNDKSLLVRSIIAKHALIEVKKSSSMLKARKIERHIKRVDLNPWPEKDVLRILDAGCQFGEASHGMARHYRSISSRELAVVGIEKELEYIIEAEKNRTDPDVIFVFGNLDKDEFDRADIVISMNLLLYTWQIRNHARSLIKHVKDKSGTIYFSPSKWNSSIDDSGDDFGKEGIKRLFAMEKELKRLLPEAEVFTIETWKETKDLFAYDPARNSFGTTWGRSAGWVLANLTPGQSISDLNLSAQRRFSRQSQTCP